MALYPLSAFRAMNAAALRVYEAIRKDGTQKGVVESMQTRDELYDYLDYHAYEKKLDSLFARDRVKTSGDQVATLKIRGSKLRFTASVAEHRRFESGPATVL